MADIEHANPFAKNRRTTLVRNVLGWTIAIVVIVGGFAYFTRTQQSSILILGSTSDVSISLNGRAVQGKNDPRGISVPVYSGEYRLTLTRPDNEQFSQDVSVPAGITVSIRPVYTLYTPPSSPSNSSNTIDYVVATPDQKNIYYLGDDRSRLYRMEVSNRSVIPLTQQPLSGVSAVEWSNDPSVALVIQTNGIFLQEIPNYDFKGQHIVHVADDFLSPKWDPNDNSRIGAAYFAKSGEKSLVLVDKRFTTIDRKADLSNFTNPKIIWSPDSKYIAVINRANDPLQNNLWLYNLSTGEFRALTSAGTVLDASFSPGSNAILYETLTNNEHTLRAKSVATGTDFAVSFSNTVKQTAWRDDASFYTTGSTNNSLSIHSLNGDAQDITYSGPSTSTIRGMFYFSSSQTLVFYTENTVYTVSLNG